MDYISIPCRNTKQTVARTLPAQNVQGVRFTLRVTPLCSVSYTLTRGYCRAFIRRLKKKPLTLGTFAPFPVAYLLTLCCVTPTIARRAHIWSLYVSGLDTLAQRGSNK